MYYEAGDAPALVHALQRLAGDPLLRRRLVEGGVRTASRFTADRYADTLEAWHVAAAQRAGVAVVPPENGCGETPDGE